MDLWDLTRLLFRRWYIALPILLSSVLIAAFAGKSVEPDYRATGNMVFIPARGTQTTPKPGEAARPKNPWLDLGFNALGNAAILKVVDKETLETLNATGLSDSIIVLMNERSPLLSIEATADTPAKATATVRQVIKLLAAEIESQQKQFSVAPEDMITTLTLNDGADVETVTSKVKRVLIVIAGLGLLLTAAGTIGIDALLRLRARKKRGAGDDGESSDAEPTQAVRIRAGAAKVQAPIKSSVHASQNALRPGYLDPRTLVGGDSDATSHIPVTRMTGENGREPAGGDLYSVNSSDDVVQVINDSKLGSTSGDETVILPSPAGRRGRRDDRSGGR
jgi:capsular polysaccharide biosynthesis protein